MSYYLYSYLPMSNKHTVETIHKETLDWLVKAVIGLNLCPFAAKPHKRNQINIEVCEAKDEQALMEAVITELTLLEQTPIEETETTILVIPYLLEQFDTYNRFLDVADMLIEQFGWGGTFQIASFHPDYYFDGTESDDESNLTNRSPYPILHLIREESIDKAQKYYGGNVEDIPDINIKRIEGLSEKEKVDIFPYLFKKKP